MSLVQRAKGLTFAVLLIGSSAYSVLFMGPVFLPIICIRPAIFRRICDSIVATWIGFVLVGIAYRQLYPTFLN